MAKPLLLLAEGVKQVAQGDLTPKAALQSKDELSGLTRSFADMTQQLADARAAVQRSMSQVNASHANLQTILDNLTAGVIVLDVRGNIQTSNPGATRILRASLQDFQGQSLGQVPGLEDFAQDVLAQFADYLNASTPQTEAHWQQSFELHGAAHGSSDNAITLIARGAKMPGTEEYLLVFDDISDMVSAQRAEAWGELLQRALPPAAAQASARNQKSAHAHSAVRRAAGNETLRQGRPGRAGAAHQIRQNHRRSGGCHEASGQ